MKVEIAPAALDEVQDAAAWYEARQPGLGAELVEAFDHGIAQIGQHPEAWHPLGHKLRRYRLSRFPYGIVYVLRGDVALVIAFAHQRRRPRYWRTRLQRS